MKFKIKGKKPTFEEDAYKLTESSASVKKAKVVVPDLSKKKKKGKIIIRKKKGKVDKGTARNITDQTLDTGMEKARLKNEKDLYKRFLKGMK